MAKFLVLERTYQALHAAGVFADDPKDVSRVVIDLQAGSAAKVYVQKFADDSLIDVMLQAGLFLNADDDQSGEI